MTDLEIMKGMLTRAGVEFEFVDDAEAGVSLRIYGGYDGFYTLMKFRRDGSLESIEAYE